MATHDVRCRCPKCHSTRGSRVLDTRTRKRESVVRRVVLCQCGTRYEHKTPIEGGAKPRVVVIR